MALNMERETGFKHGKGQKSKPLMKKVQLTASVKLEHLLTASAKSPPQLGAILEDKEIVNLAIITDRSYILLENSYILHGILVLIAFYYITDLEYPRCYSQILGLVQHLDLQQSFDGFKTSLFIQFVKKLLIAMEDN